MVEQLLLNDKSANQLPALSIGRCQLRGNKMISIST